LNKTRVERLIASRQMTAVGMKMIDLAKSNGQWDAHAKTEALDVPPELKKALNANAAAKKNWPTYTESQRKAFLRMVDAKRPETRARRVAQVVDIVGRKVSFSQLVKESMSGKSKR
jgi:uncharacterized protein YdeI (YjbR/CyaY-like superfamily)